MRETTKERMVAPVRKLGMTPSKEVEELVVLEQDILNDERDILCPDSEFFFVCNLVAALKIDRLREHFRLFGFDEPSALANLITSMTTVAELRTKNGSITQIPQIEFQMKRIGLPAGVIMHGTHAGLVADYNMYGNPKMLINRVWADNPLPEKRNFSFPLSDLQLTMPDDTFRHLQYRTDELLRQLFDEWVNQHTGLISEREHFFALCHELGIPVDTDRFHYTIPVI